LQGVTTQKCERKVVEKNPLADRLASFSETVGKKAACDALETPRASFYRHLKKQVKSDEEILIQRVPPLTLSEVEKDKVFEILHCERFQDQTPHEIYATLLDEGQCYCSIRTMYRLLAAAHGTTRERCKQITRRNHAKLELLAEQPNQV